MFKWFSILWLCQNVFTLHGSKKGGGKAPDYTPLAKASEQSAIIAKQLGDAQLAESKRQFDQNTQVSAPVVQAQLGLMGQQQAQGNDYYNYNKEYSRPVEQSVYYEAMGFTPEEIAQITASQVKEQATNDATNKATAAAQAAIPQTATFDIPTYTNQPNIPTGAVKGDTIANGRVRSDADPSSLDPRYVQDFGFGSRRPVSNQVGLKQVDPNSYYLPNNDGSYRLVNPNNTITEGTKTVTVNIKGVPTQVPANSVQSTPLTDALTAQIGALASQRMKATDKAERDAIDAKSQELSQRLGETNTQVYERNKDSIDAQTNLAVADSRNGATDATNAAIRQGLRYGYSPDRIAAQTSLQNTSQAEKEAMAANTTRTAATDQMYGRDVSSADQALKGITSLRSNRIQDESIRTAKKLDAAGLYRNLTGASQGAYGLSVNAGNAAVNNQILPSQQFLNGNKSAADTILQGTQERINGLTGVINSQTSRANANSGDSGLFGALGSVAGSGLSAYINKRF